jgi:hypothetical protein
VILVIVLGVLAFSLYRTREKSSGRGSLPGLSQCDPLVALLW